MTTVPCNRPETAPRTMSMRGPDDDASLVTVRNVRKTYGARGSCTVALDDVCLEIARGEFCGIMGPSGSGKSTLLACMASLAPFDSGEITLDGYSLRTASRSDQLHLRRKVMSYVFQDFSLIPTLTARENVELPAVFARRKIDAAAIDRILEACELGSRQHHYPRQLSGGQQQRVAFARAVAAAPKIIFADEPTGNLDRKTGTSLLRTMRSAVSDLGQTIVMVTHDPSSAWALDRVAILVDGGIEHVVKSPTSRQIVDILENSSK